MSGKGKVFHINGGGLNKANALKMLMESASEGLPIREWKPYKVPQAMLDAQERASAYLRLPSLVK